MTPSQASVLNAIAQGHVTVADIYKALDGAGPVWNLLTALEYLEDDLLIDSAVHNRRRYFSLTILGRKAVETEGAAP